jgi:hypothetical protein
MKRLGCIQAFLGSLFLALLAGIGACTPRIISPPPGTITLSGVVQLAPVKNERVKAYRVLPTGEVSGSSAAEGLTDANGTFSLSVPPGTYVIKTEGVGEHLDEATGQWQPACELTSLVDTSEKQEVPVTPMSTLFNDRLLELIQDSGKSIREAKALAQEEVAPAFDLNLEDMSTVPVSPYAISEMSASERVRKNREINVAEKLAVFSHFVNNFSMAGLSENQKLNKVMAALRADFKDDGELNGSISGEFKALAEKLALLWSSGMEDARAELLDLSNPLGFKDSAVRQELASLGSTLIPGADRFKPARNPRKGLSLGRYYVNGVETTLDTSGSGVFAELRFVNGALAEGLVDGVPFSKGVQTARTLYFKKGTNNDWATLGNWWNDSQMTIPATAIPTPIDSVIAQSSIRSNSTSTTPTILNFTMEVPASSSGGRQLSTGIIGGGILVSSSVSLSINLRVTGTATFKSGTYHSGTLQGNAVFLGTSYNSGTIQGVGRFELTAKNQLIACVGLLGASCSGNEWGTVTGSLLFIDSSNNLLEGLVGFPNKLYVQGQLAQGVHNGLFYQAGILGNGVIQNTCYESGLQSSAFSNGNGPCAGVFYSSGAATPLTTQGNGTWNSSHYLGGSSATACGTSGSLSERISDCLLVNGSSAQQEPVVGKVWSLVTLTSSGNQIWFDEEAQAVWSDVTTDYYNWYRATGFSSSVDTSTQSGDNAKAGGTIQPSIPVSVCKSAASLAGVNGVATYQNPDGTNGTIDERSKKPMISGVNWVLPELSDFNTSQANGLNSVVKNTDLVLWTNTDNPSYYSNMAHKFLGPRSNPNGLIIFPLTESKGMSGYKVRCIAKIQSN